MSEREGLRHRTRSRARMRPDPGFMSLISTTRRSAEKAVLTIFQNGAVGRDREPGSFIGCGHPTSDPHESVPERVKSASRA